MAINLEELVMSLEEQTELKQSLNDEIAIIGVACRFGKATDKETYWSLLKNGIDSIREFPELRKKNNNDFLKYSNEFSVDDAYYIGGFLDNIDKFDYEFFNISPMEANLMSPEQRIFLETAWTAIEDAGYGGKKLKGTNTGVFLGHSTDFGFEYKEFIKILNPELSSLAISGNLHSIISSRISYLLDLKGPSMVIDTACSSSLVAVYTACQALKNKECDMALAGAIKIDLLPLKKIKSREDEIGITSLDGKARAFDDNASGTSSGEGVGVVLLKTLRQALEDRDHIYAIIKGGAINQDGNSANLTSPNSLAQEQVILKAWEDAKTDPKTISYIEAHGTGTRLGDPIEINGIERAFRKYTTKKQFCGIGSVKTNLGHLDNAAGMASLIKMILSLEKGKIPPSLHFKFPNRNINYEDSPIYVNDIYRDWKSEYPVRRCGISAFGLSGTNCHLILEEYLQKEYSVIEQPKKKMLALSAQTTEGMYKLIWSYQVLLSKYSDIDMENLCYTANSGRGHYEYRIAILFDTADELKKKLEVVAMLNLCDDIELDLEGNIFFGNYKLTNKEQDVKKYNEMAAWEKENYTDQANLLLKEKFDDPSILKDIAQLYCKGAEMGWEYLYKGRKYQRVSLPTYQFDRKRCWIKTNESSAIRESKQTYKDTINHPLLSKCIINSYDRIIYESYFNVRDFWVFNEHKVIDEYVIPGVAYLEMVQDVVRRHYNEDMIELKDVIFMKPLMLNEDKEVQVHTIIKIHQSDLSFLVTSKSDENDEWIIHTEGRINLITSAGKKNLDINTLKQHTSNKTLKYYNYQPGKEIKTGPRWQCLEEVINLNEGVLAYLSLNNIYQKEAINYHMHPALMDEAVNITLRSIGEGIYLPFSYKSIKLYDRLPSKVYSFIKQKNQTHSNNEVATFDVILADVYGKIVIEIQDYTIRKISDREFSGENNNIGLSNIEWKTSNTIDINITSCGSTVVIKGNDEISQLIIDSIRSKKEQVIEVDFGERFIEKSNNCFEAFPTTEDYKCVFASVNSANISRIIYCSPLKKQGDKRTFEDDLNRGIYGLCNLMRCLANIELRHSIKLTVIGEYGYKVEEMQQFIYPENAMLYSFLNGIHLEIPKLECYSIDIDKSTDIEQIVSEIYSVNAHPLVAYRNNKKYIPYIKKINLERTPQSKRRIVNEGVYIITGGTGALGLECAKYLASKAKVKIILISRSSIQESTLKVEEKLQVNKKIKSIEAIKQMGSEVFTYQCDVSDLEVMKNVFEDIYLKQGKINGVLHLAGVAGDKTIINKTPEQIKNVINPKVRGTWVINQLYDRYQFDFVILFSSVSAIVAEGGQIDYSAANSYLDAFSQYGKMQHKDYITINWPAWSEIGMAVEYNVDLNKEYFAPIKTKDALSILDDIFRYKVSNVIVGTINSEVNNFEKINSLCGIYDDLIKKKKRTPIENNQEIILMGKKEELYTELEIKLAHIFSNILGVQEINVYDDFMELGLNSILIVKLELELEKQKINVTLVDLYEYNSINKLANFLESKKDFTKSSSVQMLILSEDIMIKNINPFNSAFYKSCFHNSLFPIIEYFDGNILDFIVYDNFMYEYDMKKRIEDNNIIYTSDKPLFELFRELGLEVDMRNYYSESQQTYTLNEIDKSLLKEVSVYLGEADTIEDRGLKQLLSDIQDAICNKNPIIIWIDCFYESIRRDTFNKLHWPHTLLIIGFNLEKQIFYVMEHSSRETLNYKVRELSFTDLINAYEGFANSYGMKFKSPSYLQFSISERSMKRNALNTNLELYKNNLYDKKSNILKNIKYINDFLQELNVIILKDHEIEESVDKIIIWINKIIDAKQMEQYLINKVLHSENTLSDELRQLINQWLIIRKSLITYSYSKDRGLGHLLNVIDKLRTNECAFYKALFEKMSI